MNYIFIDVDGVLNNEKWLLENHEIDGVIDHVCDENVAQLKRIAADTGAKVVVSSSWRHGMMVHDQRVYALDPMTKVLMGKLEKARVKVVGITPSFSEKSAALRLNVRFTRDLEIFDWAMKHLTDGDNFIALDDEPIDTYGILGEHFIQTTFAHGLTAELADTAISFLKKPKIRSI